MRASFHLRIGVVVVGGALLVSARADTAPSIVAPVAPQRPIAPGVVAALAARVPTLGVPTNNALYEPGTYPIVNVEVSWTFDHDASTLKSFEVCAFKSGQSCGPLDNFHFGKSATVRSATIGLPLQPGSWKWQVGACPKNGNVCEWSEARSISVVPKLAVPEQLTPAENATQTVPGTLTYTWKDVPGAQFYRFCDQDAAYGFSWQCPSAPTESFGNALALYQVAKPIFIKSYATGNDMFLLVGAKHAEPRGWAVEACHLVWEQSTSGPVEVARCTRSGFRHYTATKSP